MIPQQELCAELERLKLAVYRVIRILNAVNEQHLREGGVFWQREVLRAKYVSAIGPLQPDEFKFLHCVITLLHIGAFLGLVSSSVLYGDRTTSRAASSADNSSRHDTGHASSDATASSSGQSQARKRPARSADPVSVSPLSVPASAINSPDIDIDLGTDGNFSDLSLNPGSNSSDGIGFDLDCFCDRLPCLAKVCVSKPKK